MVAQLTSPKEFELAKVRIKTLLDKNGKSNLKVELTSYPAIAAINSNLASSNNAVKIVSLDGSKIATETHLWDSIESLVNLKSSDGDLYNLIVKSKGLMLAMTNAATVVSFDSAAHFYDYKVTVNDKTVGLQSLETLFDYAAARELASAGQGAASLAAASDVGKGNLDIFQCIYGELEQGDTCPSGVSQWTSPEAKSLLLKLNVLAMNEIANTTPDGTLGADGIDGTGDAAVIGGMVTSETGYYDMFDDHYTGIVAKFGSMKKFLEYYNGLNYEVAVTRAQYNDFKKSIYEWNGFDHSDRISGDKFISNLLSKGLIKADEANTDLGSSGKQYLLEPAFRLWGNLMPLPSDLTKSAWFEFSNDKWFHTFATDRDWAQLLATSLNNGKTNLTFEHLKAIEAAGAEYGIFGDGTNTATAANFHSQFGTSDNARKMVAAGVHINSFTAGLSGGTDTQNAAVTEYKSLDILDATKSNIEFDSHYQGHFNKYMTELLTSQGRFFWDSAASLMTDASELRTDAPTV